MYVYMYIYPLGDVCRMKNVACRELEGSGETSMDIRSSNIVRVLSLSLSIYIYIYVYTHIHISIYICGKPPRAGSGKGSGETSTPGLHNKIPA